MADQEEALGTFSTPSGQLAVLDFGLMDGWSKSVAKAVRRTIEKGGGSDDTLDEGNVVAIGGLPTTTLPVVGVRVGKGRWADLWQHIEVKLDSSPAVKVEEIGVVWVERARLMFADPGGLDAWVHDGTLDGKADLAFWGRDAKALAKVTGAKLLLDDGESQEFGFTDLPLEEAKKKYEELGELCAKHDWVVRPDPREHDHHFQVLQVVRATKHNAASVPFGKGELFAFMTGFGDGTFPVQRCLDAKGKTVGIRVQLATKESIRNMNELND